MPAPLIPDSAPFSPEQRAWLNGFFAGLLSLDGLPVGPADARPTSLGTITPLPVRAAPADPLTLANDDEAPWHDAALPLAERMALAEGRPLRRRMMAAMAQQDCGQCGYLCETYADALFSKKEARLNLCVPGGKETQRMLKALAAEIDGSAGVRPGNGTAASPPAKTAQPTGLPGYTRDKPVMATFLGATLLNKTGSEKETRHVELDINDCRLDYRVGDSLGVFVSNPPHLVEHVISRLGASADAEVGDGNGHSRALGDALLHERSLGQAPDALFELLADAVSDPTAKAKLKRMAEGDDPDGDLDSLDVLAALEKFPLLKPAPKAFVQALEPLQPRLYSISSSPKAMPCRLHLTVDTVRYRIGGRERQGVASTFLADRIRAGEPLPVYVQRSNGFTLPADPAVPIIMIGPGTGVAPFRAFLHERRATGASGRAWLFFGHQRRAFDFFYEDELRSLQAAGRLTRLSLAFSRDQAEKKIYVQDRIREEGDELFRWLEAGAHLFVCGDAKRMAPDVERALIEVVARGGMSDARARDYIAALAKAGRYHKDVY